jgi:hypothetical protein
MKAASIAIQYESPKLAVTVAVADQSFAARLQAAIARSNKVDKQRVIEHQPAPTGNGHAVYDSAAEVSAAASRRPLVSYRRR